MFKKKETPHDAAEATPINEERARNGGKVDWDHDGTRKVARAWSWSVWTHSNDVRAHESGRYMCSFVILGSWKAISKGELKHRWGAVNDRKKFQ